MKTRREVLKAAALTGMATACGRGSGLEPLMPPNLEPVPAVASLPPYWERLSGAESPVSAMPESAAFPLGVSSGDVIPGRAIVQCRCLGSAELRVVVWSESRSFSRVVSPKDHGFVHLEVTDLEPDTVYSYAFVEPATMHRSPVGQFRSALAPSSVQPVTFGAVSCTDPVNDLSALEHASRRTDLNAFLLLGDTTYADGAQTLQEFRDKWAASLGRPEYRALRAQTPLLATWDDHEVDNDWNPELISSSKLANARAALFEHLPLRRDADFPDRVWKSVRFGHTAEVFVLDSRSERKPSTVLTGGTEYLSAAQMAWLKDALVQSPCVFKVLMNSVPISQFPFSPFNVDSWNGYVAQRRELLEFIDAHVPGVLWVSGDHHFASLGRVSPSGPGSNQVEALAGPGAQDPNPLWRALTGRQFDWATGDNNYLALRLEPSTREARLTFFGKNGLILREQRYTL